MNDLPSLLNRQYSHLADMLALLQEEFSLIEQRQALSLPELAQRKQTLVGDIQSLDEQIASFDAAAASQHQPQVKEITSLLQACQEQNDINGKLLELSITANRRLAGLLAQLRDRNSLTYDARGHTRSGTRSRSIKA